MSSRELKDLKLPSGKIARIVTYFNRKEARNIAEKRYEGISFSIDKKDQITAGGVSPIAQERENDAIVSNGLKQIKDGETATEVTQEIINELRIEDFDCILVALKKVFFGKKTA